MTTEQAQPQQPQQRHRTLYWWEPTSHPVGKIFWESQPPPGEPTYHFDPGAPGSLGNSGFVLCGKPNDQTNVIGTYGVQLCDEDLGHEWLKGLDPCKGCWSGPWWTVREAKPAILHGRPGYESVLIPEMWLHAFKDALARLAQDPTPLGWVGTHYGSWMTTVLQLDWRVSSDWITSVHGWGVLLHARPPETMQYGDGSIEWYVSAAPVEVEVIQASPGRFEALIEAMARDVARGHMHRLGYQSWRRGEPGMRPEAERIIRWDDRPEGRGPAR